MSRFAALADHSEEIESKEDENNNNVVVDLRDEKVNRNPSVDTSDGFKLVTKKKSKAKPKQTISKEPKRNRAICKDWATLLPELLVDVIKSVPKAAITKTFYTVSLICKHWNSVVNSSLFWKMAVERKGYGTKEQREYICAIKEEVQKEISWKKLFKQWYREELRANWLQSDKRRYFLSDSDYVVHPKDIRRKTRWIDPEF
jgi:hypothetical protein